MKIINFTDKHKAEELEKQGFKYHIQTVGETTVFSFIETPDLLNALSSKYSACDYYISSIMKFR